VDQVINEFVVCVSVCLSLAAFPHYCTDPDVIWGMVGVPSTVVHFLADLQSLHGFRCYDNIDACKLIALYTANAYSADREMPASACTRCMAGLSKVVSFNLPHLQLAPSLG